MLYKLNRGNVILHDSNSNGNAFCEYFQNLFNKSSHGFDTHHSLSIGKTLTAAQTIELDKVFTYDEIVCALREIHVDKTFSLNFFLASWNIFGKQFFIAIKCFTSFKLPSTFKHTLLILILKAKHIFVLSDFHPISLCTTIYKIIVNVLANHLKLVLHSIINLAQSMFIRGRDVTDNIVLAQKICGDLNMGNMSDSFCSKLDLMKAFDYVDMNFLLMSNLIS